MKLGTKIKKDDLNFDNLYLEAENYINKNKKFHNYMLKDYGDYFKIIDYDSSEIIIEEWNSIPLETKKNKDFLFSYLKYKIKDINDMSLDTNNPLLKIDNKLYTCDALRLDVLDYYRDDDSKQIEYKKYKALWNDAKTYIRSLFKSE